MKYAAVIKKAIHHEGDQRSKDCPGHGYPAWTEYYEYLQYFDSREEMANWALNNSYESLIEFNHLYLKTTAELV